MKLELVAIPIGQWDLSIKKNNIYKKNFLGY